MGSNFKNVNKSYEGEEDGLRVWTNQVNESCLQQTKTKCPSSRSASTQQAHKYFVNHEHALANTYISIVHATAKLVVMQIKYH